jgi:hypothetical protein
MGHMRAPPRQSGIAARFFRPIERIGSDRARSDPTGPDPGGDWQRFSIPIAENRYHQEEIVAESRPLGSQWAARLQ